MTHKELCKKLIIKLENAKYVIKKQREEIASLDSRVAQQMAQTQHNQAAQEAVSLAFEQDPKRWEWYIADD